MPTTVPLEYVTQFDPAKYSFPTAVVTTKIQSTVAVMAAMLARSNKPGSRATSSFTDLKSNVKYTILLTLP